MIHRTVIHTHRLTPAQRQYFEERGRLESHRHHYCLHHPRPLALEPLRRRFRCDLNTLPPAFDPRRVRLVVSDLDSTLIAIETIDELAAEVGAKSQVAAITERAMAGELDFAAALRERVALLEGLPATRLAQVFEARMKPAIQPGAAETLAWLKRHGIVFAVVSGGFTFFTERLQKILPIDHALACRLEMKGGRLTGRVAEPIVDKDAKAAFLLDLARRMGLDPMETVALGDGANDVAMLQAAGLGIAYHGHTIAREHADACIDFGDWHALRQLLEHP